MTRNEVVARFLTANRGMVARYLGDLKPSDFDHQPLPGVNSPAWVLGHLVLVERKAIGLLGGKLDPLPEGFEARFATTGKPAGPPTDANDGPELLEEFYATRDALIAAVIAADDATLDAPHPRASALFQTVGEFAAFMAQHTAMHVGQVTVARRSLGYPPVS